MTDEERYRAAAHAMQSAVAYFMNVDGIATTPKHLRVGVNSAFVEHGALVKLLLEKGVFTEEEYYKALADKMEEEVESYRKMAVERTGNPGLRFF